jgi:uncharacterized protein
MKGTRFTVNSRKYDLKLSRSWSAYLIERTDEYISLEGFFDKDVSHPDLGLIRSGTRSVETFYLDNWYNHFAFFEPGGEFRNHYINISMPPSVGDTVVDYVDLDIDIILWPSGGVSILDIEEFEENARRYEYPLKVYEYALQMKDKIISSPTKFTNNHHINHLTRFFSKK